MVLLFDVAHELVDDHFGFNLLLLNASAPRFFQCEYFSLVCQCFAGAPRLYLLGQVVLLQAADDVEVLIARELLFHPPVFAGLQLLSQGVQLHV